MPSVTGYALQLLSLASNNRQIQRHRDICYGEHPRQQMDIYRPQGTGARPVVMFIHGGYWSDGERAEYRVVGNTLAQRGYLAVVISYRLYPEVRFPEFINDAAAALARLRKIAADYGGDPQRIYIGGHSAGAHSALMLALDPQYLRAVGGEPRWIQGVFGLSGPYDFLPPKADKVAAIFGPAERYPQGNTVNFVSPRQPPTLLIHGREDRTVAPRNSQRLAELLRAAGNEVQLLITPGGHASPLLALSGLTRRSSEILPALDNWIAGAVESPQAAATLPDEALGGLD